MNKQGTIRVLVIDDDKIDREVINRYLLQKNGAALDICEASDGRSALDMLKNQSFNCIFLDYMLPDMDGISFLREIYDVASDLGPAPLVMLTGQEDVEIMTEALRWGVQDYLPKAWISPGTLKIAMAKACELYDLKKKRRQVEDQLRQAGKLEAVGRLTSGIAHDFNNLLTVILGTTRLLEKSLVKGDAPVSIQDILKKNSSIEDAARKGAELVRRMMVFTRQRPLDQAPANINQCIPDIFELIRRTLGESIQTQLILAPDIWMIAIDVGQFENALINIALNARDAMPEGGKLIVETSNVVLDEYYAMQYPDVIPGSYVMISVTDTGMGMPREVASRIFEPFFSTKPAGQGTGLGLSMTYGFVAQSGGHVNVYSEEGKGTVFRVYLPKMVMSDQGQAEQENFSSHKSLTADRGTILVTDDDTNVRTATIHMLQSLGYNTLQAQDAQMAYEILKKDHDKIDLLFTDIYIGQGMSGVELARQAHKAWPDLKVLYTTGFPEYALSGDEALNGSGEVLSKPYHKDALDRKVREVLRERRA